MGVVAGTRAGVNDQTKKRLDELQQGYKQGQNVTDAYTQMVQQQALKPGQYQQSAAVTNYQNALAAIQNAKPGSYTSKYAPALESIAQQIQNPEEFKYEFNGDELFKSYADLYTQKGKQAANDVMGQAAALTGGYGNSYAESVGQQQYQQNLLNLYDKGMDLRNAAYQKYLNDRADLKDQFNMLQGLEESDYSRYRDTVGDWRNDLNYYTDAYNNERNLDYSRYRDTYGDWLNNLNYYTDLYNNERSFDYNKYSDMLQTMMNQAAAEEANYWNQMDMAFKREQWEWQIAQLAAEAAGGGGGGGGYTPKQKDTGSDTTQGTSFQDATRAVQTNTLKNNQNLPASTLNSNLTGTVADFVKAAQNKLASMPATLQAAITGTKSTNNKTLSRTTPAVSSTNKFKKGK